MNAIKYIVSFSLIITVPFVILFGCWLGNTFSFYYKSNEFESYFNLINKGRVLERTGEREFIELKYELLSKFTKSKPCDIQFIIKSEDYKKLNSNLPDSGYDEKNAFAFVDDTIVEGKLRYRGDFLYHWIFPHKSWRFKTNKNSLYQDVRKWNFITMKNRNLPVNHISYKLAKMLGLMAPDSSLKTVSVNNRYNGLKVMVEQIDESFLRNNYKMPTDIYKGDQVGNKKYHGVDIESIFDSPSLWDKVAINNHYNEFNKNPLITLFDDIENNRFRLVDKNNFAQFLLFVDLACTYHYDEFHNWILQYDTYSEKFHPIIWDPSSWQQPWIDNQECNINSSKMFKYLYNDYDIIRKKYYLANEFFKNTKNKFMKMMDHELLICVKKVEEHGHSYSENGTYQNPTVYNENSEIFKNIVSQRLQYVEHKLLGKPNYEDYSYFIADKSMKLSINGTKLVNKIIIELNKPSDLTNAHLSFEIEGKRVFKTIKYFNNKDTNTIILDSQLLANIKPTKNSIKFTDATYDIHLEDLDLLSIKSVYLSTLSSTNEIFPIKSQLSTTSYFNKQKNILPEIIKPTTQIWSGSLTFDVSQTIDTPTIIKPGTVITLHPNICLKFYSKLTAIGTSSNPIKFISSKHNEPWGSIVLLNESTNDSRFEYCYFTGGSGDKGELFEYTAMLSLHNTKNLFFNYCSFNKNFVTDDMVHMVYSNAIFLNCDFNYSLSDAIDCDVSSVIFDSCKFTNSGNDSIDLMNSKATISNSIFIASRDKGISIGERSHVISINNTFITNNIGIQIKDSSIGYDYNSHFENNKIAVDAYHKNWRYSEGGILNIQDALFENNVLNATCDKNSRINFNRITLSNSVQKSYAPEIHWNDDKNISFVSDFRTGVHEYGIKLLSEIITGNGKN